MGGIELEGTLGVWRAASVARGRPSNGPRLALARAMLQKATSTTYVAVSRQVLGMSLVERGSGDEHSDTIDGAAWIQIMMVFVRPAAQRRGVGTALLHHIFDVARARRFTGARVWTGSDNP